MANQVILLWAILMGIAGLIAGLMVLFSSSMVCRKAGAWVLSGLLLLAGGYALYHTALPILVKALLLLVYIFASLALIKNASARFIER